MRTDRQTDMTKLRVSFRNFAKARNKVNECSYIHLSLFLFRFILMLFLHFLIRYLGDTSYLHILATSPVHYRHFHLNSVSSSVPEHNL